MSSGARAAAWHSVPWDDGLGIICMYLFQEPYHYGKHALGHDFVAIGGEVHTIALAIIWRHSIDGHHGPYFKFFYIFALFGTSGQ